MFALPPVWSVFVQESPTELSTECCDLAVTENVLDYLAEASCSSLMRKAGLHAESRQDYLCSTEKKEHQTQETSQDSFATPRTIRSSSPYVEGQLVAGRYREGVGEAREDADEETARLLERGELFGDPSASGNGCLNESAGVRVEEEEEERRLEGRSHSQVSMPNALACDVPQRSLLFLCWEFLFSKLARLNRRPVRPRAGSEKLKKGRRKDSGQRHGGDEEEEEEKLLDTLLMRIRIFARMSPAVSSEAEAPVLFVSCTVRANLRPARPVFSSSSESGVSTRHCVYEELCRLIRVSRRERDSEWSIPCESQALSHCTTPSSCRSAFLADQADRLCPRKWLFCLASTDWLFQYSRRAAVDVYVGIAECVRLYGCGCGCSGQATCRPSLHETRLRDLYVWRRGERLRRT